MFDIVFLERRSGKIKLPLKHNEQVQRPFSAKATRQNAVQI